MNKIIFLDGAMGSNLAQKGVDPTPASNTKDPELVKEILKGFIASGSNIIETNTFSATPVKFRNYRKINCLGVQIAKDAVRESKRKNVKIAGSIGPTGLMVKPVGRLDFEEAVKIFKSQVKVLYTEKVDLFIIETMDDISEMRAALLAAKETAPEIPVIATMTFADECRTSTGTPAEVAARVMDSLGVKVLGVNCSFGPEGLVEVVKRMRRVTKKPIIAQANAGIPVVRNGVTVYPTGPHEYAKYAKYLVKAGASYIGGCCGTTPAHIKVIVNELKNMKPKNPPGQVPLIITSRTQVVEFGKFPVIIGERINFIAHPELKASDSRIVTEGLKQKKAGADALDVHVAGVEERTSDIVELLSTRVDLPVVLDSQDPVAIEKAVRKYPGVMLLNSISAETQKLEELLPIAKKYGLPFIALCVQDSGVPKTVKDKLKVYNNILNKVRKAGIDTDNIVVDPLVLAVASNTSFAQKTLKAVSKISNNTILGVSNISPGLPDRALLNEIFSVLAVQAGCSALIVNPLDSDLMCGVYAAALLSGRDRNARKYLEYFTSEQEPIFFDHPLPQSILEGSSENAIKEVKKALKNTEALKIINKYVLPALDKVGEQFSAKKIFLPQLIESAKTAGDVMQVLQKKLSSKGAKIESRAKILIATVKGDIHDIGKNLVVLLLKNHSFDVRDLGVDVSSQKIVREAQTWNADIIALSSLMTTTMDRMIEVKEILKKEKKKIPVIVGGAAITKKYADSIGAYYGKDAVEAVRVVKKMCEAQPRASSV